jgi:hypothetical protein
LISISCRNLGITLDGRFEFPKELWNPITGDYIFKAQIDNEVSAITIKNTFAIDGLYLPEIDVKVQLNFNYNKLKFEVSNCFPFCTNWVIEIIWDFIKNSVGEITQEMGNVFFEEDIKWYYNEFFVKSFSDSPKSKLFQLRKGL